VGKHVPRIRSSDAGSTLCRSGRSWDLVCKIAEFVLIRLVDVIVVVFGASSIQDQTGTGVESAADDSLQAGNGIGQRDVRREIEWA
jgi:hypothetical protein